MYCFLVVLFSLLQLLSVSTAAPLSDEVVKMKSKVKWMSEQLVVKLGRDCQIPADITLSPPADNLDSPSSVVALLEGYDSLISDNMHCVLQIKTEISSLVGYLYQWRQDQCSEQRPKLPLPEHLQELQSQKGFEITVSMQAMARVKELLNLMLKNLDILETC